MKWVEIITLRSLAKGDRHGVDELLRQVFRQKEPELPASIGVYRHSIVETDLSIHIHWEGEARCPCESPLGQQLSYALKGFGLLSHSIWVATAAPDE